MFISVQSINQFIKSGKVTVVSTLKKPFKKKNSILINEMEEWNEGMNSSNSKLIFDFLAGNNYPHSPHSQGVWHLLHKFHLYLIIIIICNCVKTFRPVNKQVTLKPCSNLLHKYNDVILFLAAIIILIIFLGLVNNPSFGINIVTIGFSFIYSHSWYGGCWNEDLCTCFLLKEIYCPISLMPRHQSKNRQYIHILENGLIR